MKDLPRPFEYAMDDTVYIERSDTTEKKYFNDSPCVKCAHVASCATAAQACLAYRKYINNGRFATNDIGILFNGLK